MQVFLKIISLILRRVDRKVGQKQEIPKKNRLTTRKRNLACLTCDPSKAQTHSIEIMSDVEP